MWARHFEIFLAIWLAISWLIFRYPQNSLLMYHDFIIAIAISTISLLNYKYRYIHLYNLIIAMWLIVLVYYNNTPISVAPYQNYMVIGLLLIMFAVIPAHASTPPKEWFEFLEKKDK